MQLSKRHQQILIGTLRDRDHWSSLEPSGRPYAERGRIGDAKHGFVLLDPAKWLDRVITASESTMNSRAYAKLEKFGLVRRVNFNNERMTTHLCLEPAGEKVARELLTAQTNK